MSQPTILFDDDRHDEGQTTQAFNDRARPPPVADHQKELVKLFNKLAYRHGAWRVFADFC